MNQPDTTDLDQSIVDHRGEYLPVEESLIDYGDDFSDEVAQ